MNYTEIEIEWMKEILKDKEEYIKKLEERIRFLEQCLDNKEKVNEQLRKDIKWYEKEEDRLRNIFIDKNWKVVSGWEFRELC